MKARSPTRIGYFGKIPTRSDFIKAADSLALVGLLDGWLADVMNLLSANPRWKLHYDALHPLHFAFVGTRSHRAIAGHLAASSDQSGRRYPFLMMSTIVVENAEAFLARSPLVLAPLWEELAQSSMAVLAAVDPEPPLQTLARTAIELTPEGAEHASAFTEFLDSHNVSGLEALLGWSPVRQLILGVGLLLQPLRGSTGSAARPEKSLVLPLPQALRHRYLVAAFWLDLMLPFLRHDDFELSLCFIEAKNRSMLVVGFDGAAPEALQAIIDPQYACTHQVDFEQADWVDEAIAGDAGLQKLSAYLEQGRLSLRSAHALFHETFV